MVKPEVHDTNSKGATCASDKDKTIRVAKSNDNGETKIITSKNGSENKHRAKIKTNLIMNRNYFR